MTTLKKIKKIIYPYYRFIRNMFFYISNKDARTEYKNIREEQQIYKKYRERKISWGKENPDKIFYIIRTPTAQNMFSFCITAIYYFLYAESKGYISVIAQEGCNFDFLGQRMSEQSENAWEHFFLPPAGYTIKSIRKSKNIIFCNALSLTSSHRVLDWLTYNYELDSKYWHEQFSHFLKINSHTMDRIKQKSSSILDKINHNRILGVAIRRGIAFCQDTKLNVAHNHPLETSLEKNIEDIKEYLHKWNCSYVFCACDDTEAIEILKDHFGDKLLTIPRIRNSYYINGEPNNCYQNENVSPTDNAIDYMTEIYILSQCTSLHGTRNGGTLMASIWNNNKYEHIYIYDNALFQAENKKYHLKEINGVVEHG